VVIAGFGGQGIIFAGKLLAYAGLIEEREVVFYPSYGAEMRGGTANCTVILSDSLIPSPIISHPSSAIIMSYPALEKFLPRIKTKGQVVVNTSLIREKVKADNLRLIEIPANEIAEKIGTSKSANMVVLGAWAFFSRAVSLESLIFSLKKLLPPHRLDLLGVNEKSLKEGWNFARFSN